MKKIILIFLVSLIFAQPKGNLFIVGGGKITDELYRKFIELAGGVNSKIIIIPIASEEPEEAGKSRLNSFQKCGAANINVAIFDKKTADSDSILRLFDDAKGIFFGGGDQNKITSALLGTKLLNKIKDIYYKGGVIGGTSAGAAIMSKIMLTGNELINKDTINDFITIQKNNIETKEGLGFVDHFIVDQHFVKRKRQNRLISVLLDNLKYPCVGIDESTALIYQNGKCEIIGESNVLVFRLQNPKSVKTNKNGMYSAKGITLDIYTQGDIFELRGNK